MEMKCHICKRQYNKDSEISFHAFPRATSSRTAWEIACKLQQPVSKTVCICSECFTIDSFIPKRDYGIKLLKPLAIPSIFPWSQEDNLTTNNNIYQTCIQHNMASTFKQNQDCADELASLCDLTISCNEECNLPRTPSTKDTNTEYNLSLSGTPSKGQLEDTQMPNIPNKIWRPARIDLTPKHFSTPRRALRNIQLTHEKTNKQVKKIKILRDKNIRRLLKEMSILQDMVEKIILPQHVYNI